MVLLATSPRRLGRAGHVELLLLLGNVGQDRTQALVLDNRSLVHLRTLVEGAVGQIDAVMPDRQSSVGIINYRNPFARQRPCNPGWLKNKQHLVILQRQVHRDRALFLPGKGIVEVVMSGQRTVNIAILERRLGKARVVVIDEQRQERVASRDAVDAA